MSDVTIRDEVGTVVYEGQERRAYTEVERSLASLDKRVAVLEQRQEMFERQMHSEHQRIHERLDLLRSDMTAKLDMILSAQQDKLNAILRVQREQHEDFVSHATREDDDRKAMLHKVTWFTITLVVGLGAWGLNTLLDHMQVNP